MKWAPEAEPQSRQEVDRGPKCPDVVKAAEERGMTSIVHFTRIPGLVGILGSSAIKPRNQLPEDAQLRYVYEANAADRRRDQIWHDYVNLSVTAINLHMFDFSKRQHPDEPWVILEFGPEILGDPGVVFCTTNNIYSGAHRCRGPQGFEQLFAPDVPRWHANRTVRRNRQPYETTDPQAEVLYPFELSLEHLHTVTVPDDDVEDAVEATRSHFDHEPMIITDPEAFR